MKTVSIKIFLSLFISVAVLSGSSCHKSPGGRGEGEGIYYVRFKANGEQVNFTMPSTQAQFHDSLSFGGNKIHIFAMAGASPQLRSLSIGLYSSMLLKPNTSYRESDQVFGIYPSAIFLFDNNPGTYIWSSIGVFSPIPSADPQYASVPRDGIVMVKEITATTISGSFSGTVYHEKSNGEPDLANKFTITNGEFFLPAKF